MKAAVLVRMGDFNLLLNIQVEYPGVEISQVEILFFEDAGAEVGAGGRKEGVAYKCRR